MRIFAVFVLGSLALLAQGGANPPFFRDPFADLRTFLVLTQGQADQLNRNIEQFQRFVNDKQRRTSQVQREIAEETAASPLNPGALGVRYAEIEAIRREIGERQKTLMADNLKVLNDVQKAKLKVLEEAIRLQPVIGQAQAASLLAQPCTSFIFGGILPGDGTPPPVLSPAAPLPIGNCPMAVRDPIPQP